MRSRSPQSGVKSSFCVLDLYWIAPESGDVWYTSRRLKKTICTPAVDYTQRLHLHQIIFFNCLDLYHTSPNSGERQYTSRELKQAIWSHSGPTMGLVNARAGMIRDEAHSAATPAKLTV